MAKKSTSKGAESSGGGAADFIPDALREAGKRAADLARNPVARSLLVAGLLTATAALAANKNARDTMKRTAKGARDAAEAATEAAADSANRIGAAMIDAATEAVRRMMGDTGATQSAASAPAETPAGKPTPPRKAARKPAAKAAAAKAPAKSAKAKPAAKQASARPAAAKPAAASTAPAKKAPARKSPARKAGGARKPAK